MVNTKKAMDVLFKFSMLRDLHPKYDNVKVGKYTISPIPTSDEEASSSEWQYILSFKDELISGRSHPIMEARLLSAWLSLMLRSNLKLKGGMINTVKTNLSSETKTNAFREYKTQIVELPDLKAAYELLQDMPIPVQRQFIRACEVYKTALSIISENTTFSFYLLTVSIECLSNTISNKKGKTEKFVDFILEYLPEDVKSDLKNEDIWRSILKEIYHRHRSGFTHGGKTVPEAVEMADRLNRVYVRNTIDGKEVLTPGLKWFEKVVDRVLINFLFTYNFRKTDKNDVFKDFSFKHGVVNLKTKREVKAGRVVTDKDVVLD